MEAISTCQYPAGCTNQLQFRNWENNQKGLQTFEGSGRVRRGRKQGLTVLENGGALDVIGHVEETPETLLDGEVREKRVEATVTTASL